VNFTGSRHHIQDFLFNISDLQRLSFAERCYIAPAKWAGCVNGLKPCRHHLVAADFRERDFETSLQRVLAFRRAVGIMRTPLKRSSDFSKKSKMRAVILVRAMSEVTKH